MEHYVLLHGGKLVGLILVFACLTGRRPPQLVATVPGQSYGLIHQTDDWRLPACRQNILYRPVADGDCAIIWMVVVENGNLVYSLRRRAGG